MDRVRLVSKLAYNGLRYRLLKSTGLPGRIEAISLELTHRCFCRCRMCNIWQIPNEVTDLPLTAWTDLLSSESLRGLRELDITGGEPFLRNDLGELLTWICQAKAHKFPSLKTLAITTNGILSKRILAVAEEITPALQQQGIDLVLACGMDAVGDLHDRIRNYPGAWDKLSATLDALKLLREDYPNLILGIKTTIVPDNVQQLGRIAEFAQEHRLFTIISPCIITANRFGNVDLKDDLNFSSTDLGLIKEFYSGSASVWKGHSQTLRHYLETGKVNKPCSAGFNTVFVRHNGDLFPCPLIPYQLGNITTGRLRKLLESSKAASFRKQIGSFAECQTCTEPGLERLALPFEGFTCLRHLTAMGFKDFSRMSNEMGLGKYF